MTKIDIDILVQDKIWKEKFPLTKTILKKITKNILNKIAFPREANHIEYSINFANDGYIKDINKRHRNIDKATNVLSFPSQEINLNDISSLIIYNGYMMLGDVILAIETIEMEAINENKTFINHTYHLIIHGILHLLGYDHENEMEAEIMEKLEEDILKDFGIKSPYNEN